MFVTTNFNPFESGLIPIYLTNPNLSSPRQNQYLHSTSRAQLLASFEAVGEDPKTPPQDLCWIAASRADLLCPYLLPINVVLPSASLRKGLSIRQKLSIVHRDSDVLTNPIEIRGCGVQDDRERWTVGHLPPTSYCFSSHDCPPSGASMSPSHRFSDMP